ncbi:MAG: AmmeMemoRadiSam system protein B [Candidatus Woesebacteria bacterium]|jgi:AmmeMemoRadiSam system protein B
MRFSGQTVSKSRQAAVAGSFYPADSDQLASLIDQYLDSAQSESQQLSKSDFKLDKSPRILILPHAGYEYSGLVAAIAFSQLKIATIKKVFLIGVSHQSWFSKAALSAVESWQTPLGEVAVDQALVKKLAAIDAFEINDNAHAAEHSLEVQLPFLQRLYSKAGLSSVAEAERKSKATSFKIIPILLSQLTAKSLETISQALSKVIDEDSLLIVSSDLSHYPDYDDANIVDRKTIEAILSGKIKNFEKTIDQEMVAGYSNLATCACGAEAIKLALRLAQIFKIQNIKLLKYANSGDVTGDRSRVVGYAAIAFCLNL